jgi:non-ribosomal peptide synthase protein (TIGR01720 family)
MEGHGREAMFEQLDTSETVGWFTTVYPLLLGGSPDADTGALIKSVKEKVREVPNRGFGYGALVELRGDEVLRSAGDRALSGAIEFNYLGQFDGTLNRTTAFRAARGSVGASSSEANPAGVRISINGMVHDGRLGFAVETREDGLDVRRLGEAFAAALAECIEQCKAVIDQVSFQSDHEQVIASEEQLVAEGIVI